MKRIALFLTLALLLPISCNKNAPATQNPASQDSPADQQDEEGQQEENPQEEASGPIVIDGQFEDWSTLDGAVVAKNDPDSFWPAVKELRVYAYQDYVYYYIRFDREYMQEYLDGNDILPARINLNTDGEFTSGYDKYFLRAYDFMIELSLGNGAGGWGTADDSILHQRINDDWTVLSGPNSGLTFGAGAGMEFEMYLDRTVFNAAAAKSPVPMPMGDTFQTSMRFYETVSDPNWAELSNIPNTDTGYGDLLDITFVE